MGPGNESRDDTVEGVEGGFFRGRICESNGEKAGETATAEQPLFGAQKRTGKKSKKDSCPVTAVTFPVTGVSYRVGIGGRVDADRETKAKEAGMTKVAAFAIALQLVVLSAALTLPSEIWIGQPF